MTVPAFHVEAKLHAFRKTQDGVVVSFVVSPIDMPQALALDPLGTRYILALAQIGDDEQPVPPAPDKDAPKPAEHHERRPWEFLLPQQQAGILCADKGFQKWVSIHTGWRESEDDAIDWLRQQLEIESRRELQDNPHKAAKLNDIRAEFLKWAGRVPVAVR